MPDLSPFWEVLGYFGMLVAAGFGFPIPEEVPTVLAGLWAARYPELEPFRWLALPICILGVLISDVLLYAIGRLWGPALLKRRYFARLIPPDKRERIENNFHHYGVRILLLIRWLP